MQKGKFRRFQVYGQRCSGTNALIKLLEQNLKELQFTEEYGFKHWLVSPEITIPDDVFVIVIARRVDHWLRSLYATPWHVHPDLKAMTFGQFIRAEWRTVWDQDFWGIDREHPKFGSPILEELCPESGGPFANAIAMRTAKLQNWIRAASRARGHLLVSHAELVANPAGLISRIGSASRTSTRGTFKPVTSYKGQGKKAFKASSYETLNAMDHWHVSRHLDADIEERFQYNTIIA